MRYLLPVIVLLVSCGQTSAPPPIPEKIDTLSWSSGERGVLNDSFNFYLFEYAAPSLERAQCRAESERGARARAFMALLTQDLSIVKVEHVHEISPSGEYGVTLSQEGHDLGALGVNWGHLKPRKSNDVLPLNWCDEDKAEESLD